MSRGSWGKRAEHEDKQQPAPLLLPVTSCCPLPAQGAVLEAGGRVLRTCQVCQPGADSAVPVGTRGSESDSGPPSEAEPV